MNKFHWAYITVKNIKFIVIVLPSVPNATDFYHGFSAIPHQV